jgi:hypothetical protein
VDSEIELLNKEKVGLRLQADRLHCTVLSNAKKYSANYRGNSLSLLQQRAGKLSSFFTVDRLAYLEPDIFGDFVAGLAGSNKHLTLVLCCIDCLGMKDIESDARIYFLLK